MTPAAKIAQLRLTIGTIDQATERRASGRELVNMLRGMGASIRPSASTNTISLQGISATCTWSQDTGLIKAWRAAAERRIAKLSDA